jgi:hypothetical protein
MRVEFWVEGVYDTLEQGQTADQSQGAQRREQMVLRSYLGVHKEVLVSLEMRPP